MFFVFVHIKSEQMSYLFFCHHRFVMTTHGPDKQFAKDAKSECIAEKNGGFRCGQLSFTFISLEQRLHAFSFQPAIRCTPPQHRRGQIVYQFPDVGIVKIDHAGDAAVADEDIFRFDVLVRKSFWEIAWPGDEGKFIFDERQECLGVRIPDTYESWLPIARERNDARIIPGAMQWFWGFEMKERLVKTSHKRTDIFERRCIF